VGRLFVEATVPLITIVPGLTPPIVEPDGKVMLSPAADILAFPICIVNGAVKISYTHISLNRFVLVPRDHVLSASGIILYVAVPPNEPAGPVIPVNPCLPVGPV
jgi:hypothetical protein